MRRIFKASNRDLKMGLARYFLESIKKIVIPLNKITIGIGKITIFENKEGVAFQ